MKTKQFAVCLLTLLLCGMVSCFAIAEIPLDKPLATSGEGRLYQTHEDGFKVAVLNGSYFEMGKQYGELLKDDIDTVATLASLAIVQMAGADKAESIRELIRSQIDQYPKRFRDLLDGMAEGSGLPLEEVAIAEHVVSILIAVQEGLFCSSITTWGDYTTEGQLVMGRNFDYPSMYRALAPQLCLVVFNPIDGSVPTAIFGYAGQICCVQAFNREGLVLELNVALGLPDTDRDVHIDRITMPLLITQLALDCSTMTQLDAGMKTMRTNTSLLNTVADEQSGCTYELGTRSTVKRAIDREGLNTATNFVYDPSWQSGSDDQRRSNLQNLAEKHTGQIDFEAMKQIIATPIQDGGACDTNGTLYQFVYEPATRTLSLRIPYASKEWVDVELGPLFSAEK